MRRSSQITVPPHTCPSLVNQPLLVHNVHHHTPSHSFVRRCRMGSCWYELNTFDPPVGSFHIVANVAGLAGACVGLRSQ